MITEPVPAPTSGPVLLPAHPPCTQCGQGPGIHSAEPETTRPAPGVVQTTPVQRCTACHLTHARAVAA
jgi:hypothetical protein